MIIGFDFNPKERYLLFLALSRLYEVEDFQGYSKADLDALCDMFMKVETYASQFKREYTHASDALFAIQCSKFSEEELRARFEEFQRWNREWNALCTARHPYVDPEKLNRTCNDDDLNDDD